LIDPSRPFAVASTGSATLHIRTWGAQSCTNFREHHVDGVPSGWVLFTAGGATADAEIRTHVPQLSFARHLRRIRLEGGLHLPGTSQVFFRFAPPLVRLEGAGASAVLRFNEGPPADPDPTGRFSIPEDLLDQDVIDVCCTDGDVTRRRQIYLRDQLADAGAPFVPLAYAESGERTPPSGGEWLACGVPAGSAVPRSAPLVLPLGPQDAADLVGADPGQIAQYRPTEPPEWEPIWAVIHHRRTMSATFVGSDLRPPGNSRSSNRPRLRDWKDLLWHQRKRIRPPVFEPARILWQSYQNAARYV
jgi:hypothetical protein